jgi:excisionase family DNA binding protein
MLNQNNKTPPFSHQAYPEIDLLTVREVAELLRVSVPLVRRLQCGLHIRFIKAGGRVRFNRRDVVEYLSQRTYDKKVL